ncbi:MAG: universal stress protein [Chloroflexi bacterium]|nr:universal stress protein [Chloroflexota bacterium]
MRAPAPQQRPYRKILVPVDNSQHSDATVRTAARLAQGLGATVVGLHVYAAQLHERRFMQMETGLPERYQAAGELQRQRSVHESLIGKGLRIISESYLDQARTLCEEAGVAFEGQLAEGKNYVEIVNAARSGDYDLVALGALGLGARRRSVIGSVCERVLRALPGDMLVGRKGYDGAQGIMVAIDGSPNAYQALEQSLSLAEALDQPVEVVTVFDPQFHIVAFQRLAQVLSSEAAALFRFKEQEQLHAEIIDKGLERLYRGYLEQATALAAVRGREVQTTLLAGKAFQKVLDHMEERRPWLLVAGRFGQHGTELAEIGSTTENLVRLAPCNVLVVSGALEAATDGRPLAAEAPRLPWTPEAEARLERVPAFAQPIVREAVERYAQQHDLAQVTAETMTQARAALGW